MTPPYLHSPPTPEQVADDIEKIKQVLQVHQDAMSDLATSIETVNKSVARLLDVLKLMTK